MRPLADDSPRRIGAVAFGVELKKAMAARKVSAKALHRQAQVSVSSINCYTRGQNLPRLDQALVFAESLDWPVLAKIAREARSLTCPTCRRTSVNEGSIKVWCSEECQDVARQLRGDTPAGDLIRSLRAELDSKGSISPLAFTTAHANYDHGMAKRGVRQATLERRAQARQAAIDAYCNACEPEGICRTPECPLRAFSLLPVGRRDHLAVDLAKPAEGCWGPSNRDAMLKATRAGAARRWSRDGEKERMADLTRARHAAMTDEEREALGRRISEGRKRKKTAA